MSLSLSPPLCLSFCSVSVLSLLCLCLACLLAASKEHTRERTPPRNARSRGQGLPRNTTSYAAAQCKCFPLVLRGTAQSSRLQKVGGWESSGSESSPYRSRFNEGCGFSIGRRGQGTRKNKYFSGHRHMQDELHGHSPRAPIKIIPVQAKFLSLSVSVCLCLSLAVCLFLFFPRA